MYKWEIKFVLKSGYELTVYYGGKEQTTDEVAEKLLTFNNKSFYGFADKSRTRNVFIKMDEVASASISSE